MNENNANFTPAAPNFKTLVRMNFQGLTNFPYIEEDFDALTNYGLLSKVVEYLNTVISNNNEQNTLMTNLYNAYVSLQNYVNNYFDNLDVQDEINNKLDEMAQDGSLTNLIKSYVDPIYQAYENTINEQVESQNNSINSIANMVNSAITGTPLVATSTSEMTNTNRIYVNTTDGKWYYYNGSAWIIGGTYQASTIADGSITYNLLDENLEELFIKNVEFIEKTNKTENMRVRTTNNTSVEFTSDTYFDFYKIDISSYVGKMLLYSGAFYYAYPLLFITGANDNIIFKTEANNNYALQPDGGIITITANMKYLYLNVNKGATINNILYNIGIIKNFSNAFNYNETSDLTNIQSISGFYLSDDYTPTAQKLPYFSALTGVDIKLYRLNKGQKYKITGKNWASSCAFILTDNQNKVVTKSTSLYEQNEEFEYIFTSNIDGYIYTTYHATNSPTNVMVYDKISAVDIATSSSLGVVKVGSSLKISDDGTLNVNNDNYMSSLKIGFTGDSICAQGGGYATVLHNLYGLNVQNIAVSGGHLANDTSPFCISDSIDELANDCDAYIIEGGINDYANGVPLGELSPNYTSELDQGTLYGALEKICRDLYTYHYGKYFAFLIVHNVNNRYYEKVSGHSFEDYRNVMYDVCKKYGVPIIDIGADGNMNTYNENMRELYTREYQGHGDGLHPNTLGYTTFYVPLIKKWIDDKFF